MICHLWGNINVWTKVLLKAHQRKMTMDKNRNIGDQVVRRRRGQYFNRTLVILTLLDLIVCSATTHPSSTQGKSHKYAFLTGCLVEQKENLMLIFILHLLFGMEPPKNGFSILARLQDSYSEWRLMVNSFSINTCLSEVLNRVVGLTCRMHYYHNTIRIFLFFDSPTKSVCLPTDMCENCL